MATMTAQQVADVNALLQGLNSAQEAVTAAGNTVNGTLDGLASWTGSAASTYKGAMENWLACNKQITSSIEDIISNLQAGSLDLSGADYDSQVLAGTLGASVTSALHG